MEQYVNQMVGAGMKTEQLYIEHVGQPCKRVPVAHVHSCECPGDAFAGQPRFYMGIFSDVPPVIVVNELMITYLPVNCKGNNDQKQASQCFIMHRLFLHLNVIQLTKYFLSD